MFAICYELGDLAALVGTLNASSLPSGLRNEARRYLNGGLDQWDTAPTGVFPGSDPANCPLCKIVTCSYGTLVAFIQLLRDVSAHFVAQGTATDATRYFLALADDLEGDASAPTGQNDSGRDPYVP
jgi:hypothetical protein